MNNSEKTMDKIVALCKNRGFVYPGSEIYGGTTVRLALSLKLTSRTLGERSSFRRTSTTLVLTPLSL